MREKLPLDQVYVNNSHLGELEANIRLVNSEISSSKILMCQRNEKLFYKKKNVILNTICD